jgi:hypothetical protein
MEWVWIAQQRASRLVRFAAIIVLVVVVMVAIIAVRLFGIEVPPDAIRPDSVTAVGTILLAFTTILLAEYTRRLVKSSQEDTKELIGIQNSHHRELVSLDVLFKFRDKFESSDMLKARSGIAQAIIDAQYDVNKVSESDLDYASTVLDMIEDVAYFTLVKKTMTLRDAYHDFDYWFTNYYDVLRPFLYRERKKDKGFWFKVEELVQGMRALEIELYKEISEPEEYEPEPDHREFLEFEANSWQRANQPIASVSGSPTPADLPPPWSLSARHIVRRLTVGWW